MRSKQAEWETIKPRLHDGMTVMIGGYASCGIPDRLIELVLESGITDLTTISNDAAYLGRGISKLIEAGRVRKMYTTHIGRNHLVGDLGAEGKIELILTPQGTLAEQIRADGAGLGGVLTRTGLGTEVATGKQTVVIRGIEYLLEEPLHADLALIRATVADTFGNLQYKGTTINFNPLMATAADLVLADVGEIVPLGTFAPEQVMTPGIFVDYIIQGYAPDTVFDR